MPLTNACDINNFTDKSIHFTRRYTIHSCIYEIERYKLSKQFNQVKYGNNLLFLVPSASCKTITIRICRLRGEHQISPTSLLALYDINDRIFLLNVDDDNVNIIFSIVLILCIIVILF